ncbi:hypothetical protein J6590_087439 [Homalodisca vitripennis]|nr:hypothetical protein J6590_087439 [Homalodisca vitripennis]
MLTERSFLKGYDLNPLSIPKLIGAGKFSKWSKLVVGSLQIICFTSETNVFLSITVNSITSFINKLSRASVILSTAVNTWAFLTVDRMNTIGLEDLNSIDSALGQTLSYQTDFFYLTFVGLAVIQLLPYLRFVQYVDNFYIINTVTTTFSMIQAVLMKHMVSKRMKCIVEKAAETHDILDIIATTRRALGFNQKVNEVFSLRVANAVANGLIVFLQCLSAHWTVYGLHQEVDALSWEINRRISFGGHSMEYRKKLHINYSFFLLQLRKLLESHGLRKELFTFGSSQLLGGFEAQPSTSLYKR